VIVTVAAAAVCHAGPDAEFAKRRGVDHGDLALSLQRVSGGRVPNVICRFRGQNPLKLKAFLHFHTKEGATARKLHPPSPFIISQQKI